MSAPTLGLAIIARDEEEALPRLLASVSGAFDQVALADTGSADRTVEVFEEWAAGEGLPLGHRVGRFEWRDDFGAARTYADSLLGTDWTCFANADDEVLGAGHLRGLAATAPPEVGGIALAWDYVDGGLLYPVRMARGRGRWNGRVHELLEVDGPVAQIPPVLALVRHGRRAEEDWAAGERRNELILRRWLEDEPDNERARRLRAGPELAEAT